MWVELFQKQKHSQQHNNTALTELSGNKMWRVKSQDSFCGAHPVLHFANFLPPVWGLKKKLDAWWGEGGPGAGERLLAPSPWMSLTPPPPGGSPLGKALVAPLPSHSRGGREILQRKIAYPRLFWGERNVPGHRRFIQGVPFGFGCVFQKFYVTEFPCKTKSNIST